MIRSLNLDSLFVPTSLPEIEYEMLKFNGGELHIKLNTGIDYSNVEKVVITHRVKNGDDLMKILIAKDALSIMGIKHFDLIMPYIPYARQDRKCFDGESFTLKVFTNILNSANFNKIHVLDSHSDVAPALIDNCINHSPVQYIKLVVENIISNIGTKPMLISPDSGANKKINKVFSEINLFDGVIKCDKKRDTSNGNLSGFEVLTNTDLTGLPCIIVDDICSRGGTFGGIAKELKRLGATDVYLFVTHYEGVADEDMLKSCGVKKIYKTNSMNDYSSDFVESLKIFN